ncbi:DUF2238 domain-containing protein [archaeon]|jgi:hypothetical protein|nr:DUF2238 domain-containing protein [archaeon]MBT4241869.1 DUF2238 domain-containing protein [archaeon]MBT4418416.1 DUF2238 domain-containing protein [archaeon]
MTIKKGEWLLIIFNLIYIIAFSTYYLKIKNIEFLWYIVIMLLIFGLLFFTQRITKFSYPILWALSAWGLMHMAGGGLIVKGKVLYAFHMIPIWAHEHFYILKYDQFVHAYLYFVMIFVIWHLIKNNLNKKPNMYILYPVITLTAIGIGAFNEIAEFLPVLFLKETGVGGYYNTAWDIVFNALGAILGAFTLWIFKKR